MKPLNKALSSDQLYAHIFQAWECFSNATLACVPLSGAPEGWADQLAWFTVMGQESNPNAIVLGIDPILGLAVSGEMFAQPTSDIETDDVHDALRELTHIVVNTLLAELDCDAQFLAPQVSSIFERELLLQTYHVGTEVLAQSDQYYVYCGVLSAKVGR